MICRHVYFITQLQYNLIISIQLFRLPMLKGQVCMEAFLQVGSLVTHALRTNFFGLGCPAHCGNPGLGSLLASFLLGLLVGISLCVGLAWFYLSGVSIQSQGSSPVTPSGHRLAVLSQYLHGQSLSNPRRRSH